MADIMNRPIPIFSSFLKYLKNLLGIEGIEIFGESQNVQCQEAIVSLCRRQFSFAGNDSYIPGPPQVDESYDASSDYCVFMVEKRAAESLTVNQYLFDSRPELLKVKPLTIGKGVCFSCIVRYLGKDHFATAPFLAAGVIDSNPKRRGDLTARHFDSLVAHHIIKEDWLQIVIEMFKSLNKGIEMPKHVLIDIRTPGIPGVAENVAMTNVAAPASASASASASGRYFDHITAPACYEDIQPFI